MVCNGWFYMPTCLGYHTQSLITHASLMLLWRCFFFFTWLRFKSVYFEKSRLPFIMWKASSSQWRPKRKNEVSWKGENWASRWPLNSVLQPTSTPTGTSRLLAGPANFSHASFHSYLSQFLKSGSLSLSIYILLVLFLWRCWYKYILKHINHLNVK